MAAALVALAGCGSGDEPEATAVPAPVATTAGTDTAKAEAAYVKALRSIDEHLVNDEEAAVRAGENICLDIEQDKSEAQVQKNAAARFEVTGSQAKKIVAATKSQLCSAG